MTKTNKNWLAFAGCAAFIAVAGCTPAAREDVGQAGQNLDQAAQKSAAGTAEAVDKAGEKVSTGTKEAVQDTQRAVLNAGKDVKAGAKEAADKTKDAAASVADATKDATATVALTPKVKNAIIADGNVKILDLNVDTKTDSKTVVVMGTASSAKEKAAAIADAKKALADAKSDYKLVDQLKTGSASKM